MVLIRRDLTDHPVQPRAMGRDPFHQPRLLRAPSNLALNPAREGAATASLGNLGQGLTTLTGKNFFLMSNLNLPSFSLKKVWETLELPRKHVKVVVSQAWRLLLHFSMFQTYIHEYYNLLHAPCAYDQSWYWPEAPAQNGALPGSASLTHLQLVLCNFR